MSLKCFVNLSSATQSVSPLLAVGLPRGGVGSLSAGRGFSTWLSTAPPIFISCTPAAHGPPAFCCRVPLENELVLRLDYPLDNLGLREFQCLGQGAGETDIPLFALDALDQLNLGFVSHACI